jgi:thiol-disulfide isomerase/thioredoxin
MKSKIILGVVVVLVIGGLVYTSRLPGNLDSFATCLKDKGATFYGAFWCPHCQEQKAMFGRSRSKLPYVECSTPDGNGQTEVCKDKKIIGYPTWEFADGTRETGVISFAKLSDKTSCPFTSVTTELASSTISATTTVGK